MRFQLSCSSGSLNKLLGYARAIEAANIPGVKVVIDRSDNIDIPIRAIWVEIETLEGLLAVRQAVDTEELIISGDPEIGWPGIEIYDDWRE